ncbi:hypothetical protein AB0I46_28615 [Streptomyces spectabilis]|uniref:hypothetical protein n=1 Tax=Streptomyces spectabilis TaxID=68270 RepID=UPI0033F7A9D4
MVLALYADRAGRLWRIAEICARCAADTRGCRVLDTAAPPPREALPAAGGPTQPREANGGAGPGMAVLFSDHSRPTAVGASARTDTPPTVPHARTRPPGPPPVRGQRSGRIAQRIVPHDLEPDVLRLELIELGDAFRLYQQCPEPDLAHLATLHERKARAFALWAQVSGDKTLRHEAMRAEKAALTTREMHENRTGQPAHAPASGPAVQRLLTRTLAAHARAVLDYAATHAPDPEAPVHLAVFMLSLRAARAGTGNITGPDLTGWLQNDAERVLHQLAEADWLRLPGTVAEAMESTPANPTLVTLPTLQSGQPDPFTFSKTSRSRISGWAQKVVGDRKIRKKKAGPATLLLALYTAAHTRPDGRLAHPEGDGLPLHRLAAVCAVPPDQLAEHTDLLVAADWLTEATLKEQHLHGRLSERILCLGGLL